MLVPRKLLDKLLEKNKYETVDNKLRVWKQLHWIDTDPDRYTKKVSYDGARIRVIKIDIQVSKTLAELFSDRGNNANLQK